MVKAVSLVVIATLVTIGSTAITCLGAGGECDIVDPITGEYLGKVSLAHEYVHANFRVKFIAPRPVNAIAHRSTSMQKIVHGDSIARIYILWAKRCHILISNIFGHKQKLSITTSRAFTTQLNHDITILGWRKIPWLGSQFTLSLI